MYQLEEISILYIFDAVIRRAGTDLSLIEFCMFGRSCIWSKTTVVNLIFAWIEVRYLLQFFQFSLQVTFSHLRRAGSGIWEYMQQSASHSLIPVDLEGKQARTFSPQFPSNSSAL